MINKADETYLNGLKEVLEKGVLRSDRTGTGTKSIFGMQQKYDLTKGFPILTTKKVYPRGVFGELVFFLQGRTDNKWLNDHRITIWDEWAGEDELRDLGPIYGYQWRSFGADYVSQMDRDSGVFPDGGTDQILEVLKSLKNDPFSRRHIVSAWNPNQLNEMALPPCHTMFQFYVTPDKNGEPYGLSCQLYQRSMDKFLGEPFNISSYAALTHLFADYVGLKPLEFVHSVGDAHIYVNHFEQVKLQLSRIHETYPAPTLTINHPHSIEEINQMINNDDLSFFENYTPESFVLDGYQSHPAIKAPVAV